LYGHFGIAVVLQLELNSALKFSISVDEYSHCLVNAWSFSFGKTQLQFAHENSDTVLGANLTAFLSAWLFSYHDVTMVH